MPLRIVRLSFSAVFLHSDLSVSDCRTCLIKKCTTVSYQNRRADLLTVDDMFHLVSLKNETIAEKVKPY